MSDIAMFAQEIQRRYQRICEDMMGLQQDIAQLSHHLQQWATPIARPTESSANYAGVPQSTTGPSQPIQGPTYRSVGQASHAYGTLPFQSVYASLSSTAPIAHGSVSSAHGGLQHVAPSPIGRQSEFSAYGRV